ncbi:hypothetical protein KKA85_03150 [bacterium]|nr:hypothetical protein [bacterium]MBU1674762.1 hypothetical protein [bacterium]
MRYGFLIIMLLAALPLPGSDARAQDGDGTSRDDVAVFKGRVALLDPGHYSLVGCAAGGWFSCDDITPTELGVSDLQMIVWATRNTTILIYGKWADSPEAMSCFQGVDAVKVTSGCEELPNERLAWGAIKSCYR